MSLSRRHLFGLFAGAAVAPLLPRVATPAFQMSQWSHTTFIPNEMFPVNLKSLAKYAFVDDSKNHPSWKEAV